MDSEDGQLFVKDLAYFVKTHERALANALQLQRQKPRNGKDHAVTGASNSAGASSSTITLAQALSRPYLSFTSQSIKPAKLTLTPHHLFFLLSKFEDLGVDVGVLTVRLENLNADAAPSNYVSFLGHAPKSRGKQSDADSLRSVSSVRSVMSSMSSMWSALTNSAAKEQRQIAQYRDDLKYLYSCFTKLPALRLSPDHRARLISGFEEFPFDTAVPLFVFKNVSSLEVCDVDYRSFYGWDRISEQLRSLTVKRAALDDPIDLLHNIVLDDAERRRKRSSKTQAAPATPSTSDIPWFSSSPKPNRQIELARSISAPTSPLDNSLRRGSVGSPSILAREHGKGEALSQTGASPPRPHIARQPPLHKAYTSRSSTPKYRRSSGSSGSSQHEMTPRHSASDLLALGHLPSSKWRLLRHLSLAENGLTHLSAGCFAPVAGTLQSLDLSGNLFSEIPDELATLTHLRALNLSNCMIDSLSSLSKSPLPAITTLNLRSNRLLSLAGIERLYSLERLDLRDNRLHDPTELARLTGIPEISDLYIVKNPFTRTHASHRITIFNLFRLSPGHHDDITIDTMGPLYHEKRYLVDRVPEVASKPVIKKSADDEDLLSHPPEDIIPGTDERPQDTAGTKGHRRTTSDMGPRSTIKRKKAPRRRVVELSSTEQRSILSPDNPALEPPVPELTDLPPMPHTPTTESDQPSTPEATPYHTAPLAQPEQRPSLSTRPKLDTTTSTPTRPLRIREASDDDNSPVRSPEDMGANTEAYRHKIEALKNELGPNWLSALDDRFNDTTTTNRRSFSPASRSSTLRPDNPSRGVSVTGRTLG